MKSTLFSGLLTFACVAAHGAEVTFNQQIAPMVHENCASCHHPGAAGPFSLLTYQEVSKKARTMQRAMERRYMPPWHPREGEVKFAHDRRLSDEQIAQFSAWVEAGKPQGNGSPPEPPQFGDGWSLGEPDLVVKMKEAYPVPAEGPDIYRNFALKLNLPEDKWVKAVELHPSARNVVHHSLFFLDVTGTAVEKDGKDGKPGFRGMAFRKAGSLGAYVPGSTARFLPEGLAMALPKNADLVLSTHFHPSGKPELEQSTVGIYFADAPPTKPLANIQVPPFFGRGSGIDIPAGEKAYRVTESFTLPVEVDAYSIGGHAHYVCREMKMTAKLPDGKELVLMHIDDWDLNWQDRYFFAEPIRLPAGTALTSDLVYDNSDDNPDNPFYPARRIRWGHESTDEMGSITLMVTPTENADEAQLARAARMKNVEVLGAVMKDVRENGPALLAKRIRQLDANRDGLLQEAEIPVRFRKRVLANFDRDKDGAINQAELTKLLESLRSGANRGTGEG